MLFVGVDWAEDHHDVCVVDGAGKVLAKGRVPDGLEGVARLHELVAAAGRARTRTGPRSSSASRSTGACWCGPWSPQATRWWRSTPWPSTATGTATGLGAPSPTEAAPGCWPTRCAPTATTTAPQPPTPSRPREPSWWPGPTRTPSGRAGAWPTGCATPAGILPRRLGRLRRRGRSGRLGRARPGAHAGAGPAPVAGQDRRGRRRGGRQRNVEATAAAVQAALWAPPLEQPAAVAEAYGTVAASSVRLSRRTPGRWPSPRRPGRGFREGTPRSGPAGLAWGSSPAPGCSAASVTTRPATLGPEPARTTPVPVPSPSPRARAPSCGPATCATAAWPTPRTGGPSTLSTGHPALGRSTTPGEAPAIAAPRRSGSSPTGSSASSTAAFSAGPATTKTGLGPTASPSPLDGTGTWGD